MLMMRKSSYYCWVDKSLKAWIFLERIFRFIYCVVMLINLELKMPLNNIIPFLLLSEAGMLILTPLKKIYNRLIEMSITVTVVFLSYTASMFIH